MPKSYVIKALMASVYRFTLIINKALKIRSLASRNGKPAQTVKRSSQYDEYADLPRSPRVCQSERLLGKGHTHKFPYEEFPIKIVCIIGKKKWTKQNAL